MSGPGYPIVVGTDGSPTATIAVDKAGELAHALGAPVHIVCVPMATPAYEWPARITSQVVVEKAGERLSSRGITVHTHLPEDQGDAALALVAVAESEGAQTLVVGNKGMTGMRRLLGSFPNRVSHQARCDVLIVPTQSKSLAELAGGAVVVGTDGSSGATLAVTEAIRLAQALGGELHVVSVAKPSDAPETALATAAAEAADHGVKATMHARQGDPADELLDVAETTGAAILVVGSKGMHSDDREWLGNIPDKISHKGTSSVLIVFTSDRGGSDDDVTVSEVPAGGAA
jgi:nucleotide-binding universal stress UspA family protein